MISWADKLNSAYVIYLDFIKAFDKVFPDILVDKMGAFGLDGTIVLWICNWLNSHSQRLLLNGPGGKYQGGVFTIFFLAYCCSTLFINSFENGIKGLNIRSVDDTKPDPWMFNLDNCKILHLDRNNQMHG